MFNFDSLYLLMKIFKTYIYKMYSFSFFFVYLRCNYAETHSMYYPKIITPLVLIKVTDQYQHFVAEFLLGNLKVPFHSAKNKINWKQRLY